MLTDTNSEKLSGSTLLVLRAVSRRFSLPFDAIVRVAEDALIPTRNERITTPAERIKAILVRVCELHRVSIEDIKGDRRFRRLSLARREAVYKIADECPEIGVAHIGRILNKNHTTVIYALRQHAVMNGLPVIDRSHAKCNRKYGSNARTLPTTGAEAA